MPEMSEPLAILNLKASLKRSLKMALLAGVAAAFISMFLPNYYKSEAQLLPVDSSMAGGMGNLAAAAAAFGVSIGGSNNSDANFVDILKSRWLKENLLRSEFRFHARAWRFGPDRSRQETLYTYLDAKNMDRAVEELGKVLFISKDIKTNVITITAETQSPELSQRVVQRSTHLLNQFVIENSRTRGSEKAAFAEARLADARRELNQAEVAFKVFQENNRNYQFSTDPEIRLRGASLSAELSLRQQLVGTLSLNREQALLDAKNDLPIINILDEGNLPIEKSKPSRSILVLIIFLVTGFGAFVWHEREWIRARFVDPEDL